MKKLLLKIITVLSGQNIPRIVSIASYGSISVIVVPFVVFGIVSDSTLVVVSLAMITLGILGTFSERLEERAAKVEKIATPPGTALLKIVRLFVSTKQYKNTFHPAISDWSHEYIEALDENNKLKRSRFTARLRIMSVHTRHFWAFLKVCGWDPLLRFVSKIAKAVAGK